MSRQASSEWIKDNAPRPGAAVAFYTLLSLAPIIVIAVAAAAAVYGQQAAQGRLASEIQGVAGADVARTIQEFIRGAYKPGTGVIATVLGLVILAFGASSIFVELHDAMNTIWSVSLPRDRNNAATVIRLIRECFYSFATVLATGILLLASLVLNPWIAALRTATFMVSVLVIAALFSALYKTVPDVKLNWSDVALGAIITSTLFMIRKQLMGLYFANTSYASTYGAAGLPLVVLLWVYYSAQLFFWDAEFTRVYARTVGSQCGPRHCGCQGQLAAGASVAAPPRAGSGKTCTSSDGFCTLLGGQASRREPGGPAKPRPLCLRRSGFAMLRSSSQDQQPVGLGPRYLHPRLASAWQKRRHQLEVSVLAAKMARLVH